LAVEFRGATQWDPIEAEEQRLWNHRSARYAVPLREILRRLGGKEKDMGQKLLESGLPEQGARRTRSTRLAGDERIKNVVEKVSTRLAKLEAERCVQPGCGAPVSLRRPPNAKVKGYCDVHRQLRAFSLSMNIEPDRAGAAKLMREKCDAIYIDITPALALALLEWNLNNRSINPDRIEMYARDMIANAWRPNNQGIAIGANKLLHDGQHRLWAVVKSGCSVRMLVAVGLPEDACPTIDQGRSRSVGDALQIFDGQPNGRRTASWLKAIDVLHGGRRIPMSHAIAQRELWRFEGSVRWFSSNSPRQPYGRAPVIGALIYAHAVAPEHVETFTRRYVSGANLDEESPVLALRNYVTDRVLGGADSQRVISLKTLRCLLADQRGEPLTRITASEDAFEHFLQLHNAMDDDAGRRDSRPAPSTSRAGQRRTGRAPQATAPIG
jgi:hypothetical protein